MVYDLIIIGADSAGLMAGVYAGRKKLNTLILTKKVGGQSVLTNAIENLPGFEIISGADFILRLRKQAEKYGVKIEEGLEVMGIKKEGDEFVININKSSEIYKARAVIIATGRKSRALNIPGEKELTGKGVSFCTICDAPFFSGKDVAIIGSGNSGLESAVDLLKYANKIYILEAAGRIKGDEYLCGKLEESGKVRFITNVCAKEIKGEKFVEKLIYQDIKNGKKEKVDVQGIFINIGWIAATDFLAGFAELNKFGEIIVDCRTMETSVKGVFAAGDATDGIYKQNILAAADGAKAALSVYNYLISKK